MCHQVLIALGSNLKNPEKNLDRAVDEMRLIFDTKFEISSYWYSEAIQMRGDAGRFTNAVVKVETTMSPKVVLSALENIEVKLGREKSGSDKNRKIYEDRVIDLDIITYGDLVLDEPVLTIPHPRAQERLFVLLPLQELCPRFIFPGQTRSISELIELAPEMDISD